MAKQLTVKQAKFVKAVAEGKPKYKAAMEAYDTTDVNTAATIAKENLQKTSIQEALQNELAKQGLTTEMIVAPLMKGIKAKKVVPIEGDFFETDVDDLDTQMKAHDRITKIMGMNGKESGGNTTNNFVQIINQKADKYAD